MRAKEFLKVANVYLAGRMLIDAKGLTPSDDFSAFLQKAAHEEALARGNLTREFLGKIDALLANKLLPSVFLGSGRPDAETLSGLLNGLGDALLKVTAPEEADWISVTREFAVDSRRLFLSADKTHAISVPHVGSDCPLNLFINSLPWYLEKISNYSAEGDIKFVSRDTAIIVLCLNVSYTEAIDPSGPDSAFPRLCASVTEFINQHSINAGTGHRLTIPLFFNCHPKEKFVLGEEVPVEHQIGLKLTSVNDILLRSAHLASFWKTWSYIGFPLEVIQEYIYQPIRSALGFHGHQYREIASAPYSLLRRSGAKLRIRREDLITNPQMRKDVAKALEDAEQEIKRLQIKQGSVLKWATKSLPRYAAICITYGEALARLAKPLSEMRRALRNLNAQKKQSTSADGNNATTYGKAYSTFINSQAILEDHIPGLIGAGLINQHFGKPALLIIDDDAEAEVERLSTSDIELDELLKSEDQRLTLASLFQFRHFTTNVNSGLSSALSERQVTENLDTLLRNIKTFFKGGWINSGANIAGDTTDPAPQRFFAVLIDVAYACVGNRQGVAEKIISIIKRYAPSTHILVNTHFGQDRYVFRAITEGADWFCRKEHPHRLLRSLHSVEVNRLAAPPISEDDPLQDVLCKDFANAPQDAPINALLIRRILRDQAEAAVDIKPLTQGLSRALTLRLEYQTGQAASLNSHVPQMPAPLIVKLDRTQPLMSEQQRYVRFIRPFIDNNVGRVDRPMEYSDWLHAAIAYSYAGSNQGTDNASGSGVTCQTLGTLLRSNLWREDSSQVRPFEVYQPIFDALFQEILPRIHNVPTTHDDTVFEDYPNTFFEEYISPAQLYQIRLPATLEIVAEEISEINPSDIVTPSDIELIYESQHDKEALDLLKTRLLCLAGVIVRSVSGNSIYVLPLLRPKGHPHDAPLPQLQIRGTYVTFLLAHKAIRLNQVLQITGRIKSVRHDFWSKCYPFCSSETGARPSTIVSAEDASVIEKKALEILSKLSPSPRIGIIHGDLNLENIMVECYSAKSSHQHEPASRDKEERSMVEYTHTSDKPWLIDFARARRDSIACDYSEFESVIAANLLKYEWFPDDDSEAKIKVFLELIYEEPWQVLPFIINEPRLKFVYNALRYVRQHAANNGIAKDEYLAHLVVSNLITVKVFGSTANPKKRSPGKGLPASLIAALAAKVAHSKLSKKPPLL